MQEYILYLFYLSLILLMGIMLTGISNFLGISNILLLFVSGYLLKVFGFDYFSNSLVVLLSSLALILIVLETTLRFDLRNILNNFFGVFKFSAGYFLLCIYIVTLLAYQWLGIKGNGFDVLLLCILLSIILYGSEPFIAMEFLKKRKNKVVEMLEIEGIIAGPIVVTFATYLIGQFGSKSIAWPQEILSQMLILKKTILIALAVGIIMALVAYLFLKNVKVSNELKYLFIVGFGILCFALGEAIKTNGSFAVAIFGLFLRGISKNIGVERKSSLFAHTLYIFVFVMLGVKAVFPQPEFWVKGIVLFLFYLILRFFSTILFLPQLNIREKTYFTLNVAKGIEVAIVLFIMQAALGHLDGIGIVVSLGYMFFVLSYIVAILANRISKFYT